MKKKIIAIVSALLMVSILLTGCGVEEGDRTISSRYLTFDCIEEGTFDGGSYKIYEDDQGNLYLWYKEDDIYGQTMVQLVNDDGTPRNVNGKY